MNARVKHLTLGTTVLLLVLFSASCERIWTGGGRIVFKVKEVATKGTVITTANIASEYGSFTTDVWVAEEDQPSAAVHNQPANYIQKETVSFNAGTWSLAQERNWLNDVGMCFWSWAPVEVGSRVIGTATNTLTGTLPFSYSLPETNGTTDADNQKDLLFAFNYQTHAESSHNDAVNIKFYHALSLIQFMVDTGDGTFNNAYSISNISIRNIFTSADCLYKPSTAEMFSWSNLSSKSSVGQNSIEKSFMLIPQTTPADAELVVTFISGGSPLERSVSFNGEEWLPGKYYKYKIIATSLDKISFSCIVNDWNELPEYYLE